MQLRRDQHGTDFQNGAVIVGEMVLQAKVGTE